MANKKKIQKKGVIMHTDSDGKKRIIEATCFNCHVGCTSYSFCYGCRAYVCDDCEVGSTNGEGHTPEDHLICSHCGYHRTKGSSGD